MEYHFNTVALLGKQDNTGISDSLLALADFLTRKQVKVMVEEKLAANLRGVPYSFASIDQIGQTADLAVVLGGDGTVLNAARSLVLYDVPLVGINLGRLGFLTDVPVSNMLETMDEILKGEFSAEDRFLLDSQVTGASAQNFETYALNDVVVSKGITGRLIEFEVLIDEHFVYSQRSDGLVIATPTGSTAYALSAGGPILHPSLEAVILVPICPHTLSNRPIAVNSISKIEVVLSHAEDATVFFDGQTQVNLSPGDKVIVRRSQKSIRFIHPHGHNYYDMLRRKLHWGEKLF